MGTEGIGITHTYAWGKSFRLVVELLKERGYYSKNPLLLLNFGSNRYDDSINILNKRVDHMTDKIKMNRLFDRYGIFHPKTFYYPFNDIPKRGQCVIKRRSGTGRGRGIVFTKFNKLKDYRLNENLYVQEYIPFENEYRIVNFIGHHRSRLKVGDSKIKNTKTCYFKNFRDKSLEQFSKDICRLFNVDFAGTDIGKYNGRLYCIEINSACGLNKNSAKLLVNFLIKHYENIRCQ